MQIPNRITGCLKEELHQVIEQKRENVGRGPFRLDLAHTWMKFATRSCPHPQPQAQPLMQLDQLTQMAEGGRLLASLKAPFQALLAKKLEQAFVQALVMRCACDLIYLGEEYETLNSSAGCSILRDSAGEENLL